MISKTSPSATRDAVLALFTAHPDGPGARVPTRLILAASEAIGLKAPAVRVALTRMRRAAILEAGAHGECRLASRGIALAEQGRAWSSIEEQLVRWDGSYLGVAVGDLPAAAGQARGRERALERAGFRLLQRGLFVRPDNRVGGLEAARARLIGEDLAGADFFAMRALALDEARIAAMWSLRALHEQQRETVRMLERSGARLDALDEQRALHESFHVGRAATAAVLRDPLLPAQMADASPRRELVAELRRYARASMRRWTRFVRAT